MNRDLLIITAGRVIQIAIGLLSVRVFTSLLSTAEVGNLYLVNAIFGFFGFALISPVGLFLNRRFHSWVEDRTVLDYWFLFALYLAVLSVFSAAIVWSAHAWIGVGAGVVGSELILLISGMIFFLTLNQTVIPALNLLQHRISFVVFTILTLGCGLLASVLVVLYGKATAIGWIGGQLLAQAVFASIALLYFIKVSGSNFRISNVLAIGSVVSFKGVIAFALPLAATNCFFWAQNQSYRLIIENRLGLEFLGMLGLGLSIASNISSAVEGIVHQLYMPGFYRDLAYADTVGRAAVFNALVQRTLPLFLSVTIFVTCLAPFLMEILANRVFSGAAFFLVCGAWIELARMTTNLLAMAAQAEMQTRYTVRAYFVGGIIAVGGVSIATMLKSATIIIPLSLLLSGASATLIMYTAMKKLLPVKVGIRTILKAFYVSLPLLAAVPCIWLPRSLWLSLLVTSIGTAYIVLVQYRLTRTAN
jgi:O-antigen/teichoic acid export membrane protein